MTTHPIHSRRSRSAGLSIDILVQGLSGQDRVPRRARLEHGRAGARAVPRVLVDAGNSACGG